uniref:Mediator of RNA polymerase II transcription subunit 13 n=1 Tax=Haemonchus placei TaxID=6290 RepID=A0A0N4W5V4_HAEPC
LTAPPSKPAHSLSRWLFDILTQLCNTIVLSSTSTDMCDPNGDQKLTPSLPEPAHSLSKWLYHYARSSSLLLHHDPIADQKSAV